MGMRIMRGKSQDQGNIIQHALKAHIPWPTLIQKIPKCTLAERVPTETIAEHWENKNHDMQSSQGNIQKRKKCDDIINPSGKE